MDNLQQKDFCKQRYSYCAARFSEVFRLMTTRFDFQDKALHVAQLELNRRLEAMNEFRNQLERQAGSFIDRNYYDAEHKSLRKEVEALREWKSQTEGERSRTVVISWIAVLVAALALLLGTIKAIL
jgi:hypothetical protein